MHAKQNCVARPISKSSTSPLQNGPVNLPFKPKRASIYNRRPKHALMRRILVKGFVSATPIVAVSATSFPWTSKKFLEYINEGFGTTRCPSNGLGKSSISFFGVEGFFAYGRILPLFRKFLPRTQIKKQTRVLKGQGKDYDPKRHIPDNQG